MSTKKDFNEALETLQVRAPKIPPRYNIGTDVCTRWASDRGRIALIHENADGAVERFTFRDIDDRSNQAANLFAGAGIAVGDRVAILLPQRPETAYCHIAIYKMGAIAVPLFALFGEEAIEHRLIDSGAKLLITDRGGMQKLEPIRSRLPALQKIFCTDGSVAGATELQGALAAQASTFQAVNTAAEDPVLLVYTSGTTGKFKGALLPHRTLLGHLPGVEMSHNGLGHPNDRLWTPADWAWIGGLLDVLMPAWHHGISVVSRRFDKFDPLAALQLMARHRVANVFMPPTALKMLRAATTAGVDYGLALRSVASGGESLGIELLEWGRQVLGVQINEFYGQTECNMVVSSCDAAFAPKPGWIGKAVPGHTVDIVDANGVKLPPDTLGNIGIRRPDPVMFLRYWNNERGTADKFAGDYLLTGDQGEIDEQGYIRFLGRDDDVITSAGYRIGPGPIEDCLLGHPAVRQAAVIGVADPLRTEIVKAFVVLREGHAPSEELTRALKDFVKHRLAAHEYPREVEYVVELPMTTTGKVLRRELRLRSAPTPT